MANSRRRVTAAEFDAIRPLLRISQDRIDAARAALVDGLAQQTIATPYGWTRQAVNDAVTVVWNTLSKYRASQSNSANAGVLLPPGWELVTLVAPTCLIEKFRSEIATHAAGTSPGSEKKRGTAKRTGAPRIR